MEMAITAIAVTAMPAPIPAFTPLPPTDEGFAAADAADAADEADADDAGDCGEEGREDETFEVV
jgi:hypothetical protein